MQGGGAPLLSRLMCPRCSAAQSGNSWSLVHRVGIPDYGNILVMPALNRSGKYDRESSYRSYFSHRTETARPGYYAVTLKDSGIRAELTATHHCGVHRYTFPDGKNGVMATLS